MKRFAYLALSLSLSFGLVSCSKKQEVKVNAEGMQNLQSAETFLAQNKTQPGVITTKSGLQYQVVKSGPADGKSPSYSSRVRVNYEGKLQDGKVFDSSYERGVAAELPVSELVPAWTEALQLMHPGDEWTIWVHPRLGYGPMAMPMGCGDVQPCQIPANSLLIFRMRLESIVSADSLSSELANEVANGAAENLPPHELK